MPDGIEILAVHHSAIIQGKNGLTETHVGLHIEILQIEGVFPNVDTNNGNVSKERILVSRGDNLQLASCGTVALIIKSQHHENTLFNQFATYKPAPARSLDTSRSGVEFPLEVVEGTPVLENSGPKRAIGKYATVSLLLGRGRCKVGPEERVVDVAFDDKIRHALRHQDGGAAMIE
jgi:hypothetical protein